MIVRFGLVLAMALAFSVVETSQAQAQCGLGGGYGYGFGFDVGRLYRVLGQNVPHFAAFPPVYYSAPVPRTYGYSPFAYPPGTRTPDLPTVPQLGAKEILNPYVLPASSATETEAEDKVTTLKQATEPLVVVNPYLVPASEGPLLRAVALR